MTIDDVIQGFTDLKTPAAFDEMAEAVLAHQYVHNPVYRRYCKALYPQWSETFSGSEKAAGEKFRDPSDPIEAVHLPTARHPVFLPVEAFKQVPVTAFPPEEAEKAFESSGTGSGLRSRHYVRDLSIYERAISVHFAGEFGTGPFLFASCLPGYIEQGSASSLLYMVDFLMRRFGAEGSGSVLGAPERLRRLSERSRSEGVPLIVFGAAFGLLDLLETTSFSLPPDAIVIETGGMKTHRREIARTTLHRRLGEGFGGASICSEYGMCELLSSCYSRQGGVFYPPPWMRFLVVDPAYPFESLEEGSEGALALLDLANVHSASAVLTQDRAVQRGDGFEVLGRLGNAELRGCNFLLENV